MIASSLDGHRREEMHMHRTIRFRNLGLTFLLGLLVGLVLTPAPAFAAKGGTCEAFTVSVNGQPIRGDQQRIVRPPISSIEVKGTYIEFTVDPATFSVFNHTHTGQPSPRPDKNLPFEGRTVIFESKIPLHNDRLRGPMQLSLGNESVVLERAGGFQDMKIQAKDCHQGGLFQMEPEPGTREVNTLGPDFVYTSQPPGETRLCFTNGNFSGYDSPQLATLVSHTQKKATWRVRAGGRIGMVIGEDAVEGGCLP
jgi:hypothetical protein